MGIVFIRFSWKSVILNWILGLRQRWNNLHFNLTETLDDHFAKVKVKTAQVLKLRKLICLAGTMANSEGIHKNFEMMNKNDVLVPENTIDFKIISLKSDSFLIRKTDKGFVMLPMGDYLLKFENGNYHLKLLSDIGWILLLLQNQIKLAIRQN